MKRDETKKHSSDKSIEILNVENSDVVKHTLVTLINIASTKTTKAYARSTMKTLLKKLEKNHSLFKYIDIKNVEEIEDNIKAINVTNKINSITSNEVGRAIQSLVDMFKKELGKKAGYFFIREFRDNLGDNYHLIIRNMGVDLRLSELQDELYGWDSEKYQIKDDENANIAYIEEK
jgi:hypothetical protein